MAYNHTISAILKSIWMLQPEWAEAHLPMVLNLLKGNPVSFTDRTGNSTGEMPFVIDPKSMQRYPFLKYDANSGRMASNPNLPENSVGILPISGPITKYNGDCGEPGAIQKASWLGMMEKRDNIGSVVMLLDTPGGESRAAGVMTSTIAKMKKPVLSSIDGMSASLGMFLSSASDEAYVSSSLDQVGSIGSYAMLADFSGMLEKEGIKLHEIYAPQSTDKNKDYRDAIKGDYSGIQQGLSKSVDEFIGFVKLQRPQSAAYEKEWNSGKMFDASAAQKIGLHDGVKSFDQVVSKAAWLAKRKVNY